MTRILVSWIGQNDLSARDRHAPDNLGPILATLKKEHFDVAYLAYNYPKESVQPYLEWLASQVSTDLRPSFCELSSPIDFGDIHRESVSILEKVAQEHPAARPNILLSPGTPAMQAIWILLGKTRYPATFYQSSREAGVQVVDIPFDIAAEYLPALPGRSGADITSLAAGAVPVDAAFSDIITNNPDMMELKARASVMAVRNVPVLITGETGTGKELFATAIHNASERGSAPFIAVNCGAIPPELVDSTLFGHVKGAFTGAIATRKGCFQEADGGTLFLDELGELPLEAQVRLLRVLQSSEFLPVGSTKPTKVDARIIAATNRNLIDDVAAGRFREDLFYRVAVGVLHLPPLRERTGDLVLLADALLEQINQDAGAEPGYQRKILSAKAKNFILGHPWPGNVRELYSTLLRASLWSGGSKITGEALEAALFQAPSRDRGILDRPFGNDFRIQEVIDDVVQHYIPRALRQTGGNRTEAAKLLGLRSYQTLDSWIKKHKVKL